MTTTTTVSSFLLTSSFPPLKRHQTQIRKGTSRTRRTRTTSTPIIAVVVVVPLLFISAVAGRGGPTHHHHHRLGGHRHHCRLLSLRVVVAASAIIRRPTPPPFESREDNILKSSTREMGMEDNNHQKRSSSSSEQQLIRGGGGARVSGGSQTLIFTYGTLKRGFSNHVLMQDLISTSDAVFLGTCHTSEPYPLVCGPYRVPFLLNMVGCGERVWGEMYAVTGKGLARMDELEGTSKGHYERLPIRVVVAEGEEGDGEGVVEVEAYFGHRSYALDLWRRNGEKGFGVYSEKEASGYIRRKDRPQNLTFLDQIRIFNSSPSQKKSAVAL